MRDVAALAAVPAATLLALACVVAMFFALGCGSVPAEIDPADSPPAECRTSFGYHGVESCLRFEGASLHMWSGGSTVCVCAADLDRVTVHGGRR